MVSRPRSRASIPIAKTRSRKPRPISVSKNSFPLSLFTSSLKSSNLKPKPLRLKIKLSQPPKDATITDYRIPDGIEIRELGQGAYGFVISATTRHNNIRVAIKIGDPDEITTEHKTFQKLHKNLSKENKRFFIRDADLRQELISEIVEEHVLFSQAPIFQRIRSRFPRGVAMYPMEYLDPAKWMTVQDMLAKWHQLREHRSLAGVVRAMLANARKAFETLFKAGFVHTDAHTGNVMVNKDTGAVKILDYGMMITVPKLDKKVNLSNPQHLPIARHWFDEILRHRQIVVSEKTSWWWSDFTWINHDSFRTQTSNRARMKGVRGNEVAKRLTNARTSTQSVFKRWLRSVPRKN